MLDPCVSALLLASDASREPRALYFDGENALNSPQPPPNCNSRMTDGFFADVLCNCHKEKASGKSILRPPTHFKSFRATVIFLSFYMDEENREKWVKSCHRSYLGWQDKNKFSL